MGVKRGGRQGQSLRSLRPHIGMCSFHACSRGATILPLEEGTRMTSFDLASGYESEGHINCGMGTNLV